MSIISWTSPRASETILPTSMPTRSARAVLMRGQQLAEALDQPAAHRRRTVRHCRNAACARSIARSTSAVPAKGTVATASPVTGLTTSTRPVPGSGRGRHRSGAGRRGALPQLGGPGRTGVPVERVGHRVGSSGGVVVGTVGMIRTPSSVRRARSEASCCAMYRSHGVVHGRAEHPGQPCEVVLRGGAALVAGALAAEVGPEDAGRRPRQEVLVDDRLRHDTRPRPARPARPLAVRARRRPPGR